MTNFVYIKDNKRIYGVAVNETAPYVPRGLKYYFYTDTSEIDEIIQNDKYNGIGTGENYHED